MVNQIVEHLNDINNKAM
uniref:Uncharacterized protein n=1 Tax=Rhizophora mucronata TaxID=61149 RepID=A0A2P2QCV8_RHIMU